MVSGLDSAGSDRWVSWGNSSPARGGIYQCSWILGVVTPGWDAAGGCWVETGMVQNMAHTDIPHGPSPAEDHLSQDVSNAEVEKPQSGPVPPSLLFPQSSENAAAGGRTGGYSQAS